MAKWRVKPETRRFDGPGPDGRDVSHGVNVYLESTSGGGERKIAVWYARSEHEGVRPKEAVRAFLDDDDPPLHLLVSGGGVSAIG